MMRRRRAFTLTEVVVAMLIASIVLALAWRLYGNERLRFEVDQDRMVGLEGSLLLDQSLAMDLDRIVLDLPDGSGFTVNDPVHIQDSRQLEFRIAADSSSGGGPRPIPVIYKLDAAHGRVLRVAGGKETLFRGLLAEDVQFSLVSIRPRWPRPGEPLSGRDVPLQYVKYVLTCFSERLRELPPEQRPPQGRVILVGAAALSYRTDRAFHAYWRPLRSEILQAP